MILYWLTDSISSKISIHECDENLNHRHVPIIMLCGILFILSILLHIDFSRHDCIPKVINTLLRYVFIFTEEYLLLKEKTFFSSRAKPLSI